MSDLETFGPLTTGADVERWALDTLKTWTPEYLAWAERETGREPRSLQPPRSWVVSSEVERWAEEQLPSVLLLSTGLAEEPTRDGSGNVTAPFALGLAVVVSARDRASTDELAKLYTAVFRAILLHHPSLGGHADAVEWMDERYDVLPSRSKRQLAAGQVVLRIVVPNVVRELAGPSAPRDDPYSNYADSPLVATTTIEVRERSEP